MNAQGFHIPPPKRPERVGELTQKMRELEAKLKALEAQLAQEQDKQQR